MHPYLIDWFRNIYINPDPGVIEKRWKAAQIYGAKLSRGSVALLLRLFLFAETNTDQAKEFTDALLVLDKEFPVTGNTEELRLMAGVVMLTTFLDLSKAGTALALGLRAAVPPGRKSQPVQPAMLVEAETYLRKQAEEQRPGHFGPVPQMTDISFVAEYEAMKKAEITGDAAVIQAAQTKYHAALETAFRNSHLALAGQVQRLAEESALLWWVIGEYSTSLKRQTADLSSKEYALIAGAEAADRTQILPPPASVGALLNRAISPCKASSKKSLALGSFLGGVDSEWRTERLKILKFADCTDLVPLVTGLAKSQELGNAETAVELLPKLCPGLDGKMALSPLEAAEQFYVELLFLRALVNLNNG